MSDADRPSPMTWQEFAVYAQAKGDTLNSTTVRMVMDVLQGRGTDREFWFVMERFNSYVVLAIAMANNPLTRETP